MVGTLVKSCASSSLSVILCTPSALPSMSDSTNVHVGGMKKRTKRVLFSLFIFPHYRETYTVTRPDHSPQTDESGYLVLTPESDLLVRLADFSLKGRPIEKKYIGDGHDQRLAIEPYVRKNAHEYRMSNVVRSETSLIRFGCFDGIKYASQGFDNNQHKSFDYIFRDMCKMQQRSAIRIDNTRNRSEEAVQRLDVARDALNAKVERARGTSDPRACAWSSQIRNNSCFLRDTSCGPEQTTSRQYAPAPTWRIRMGLCNDEKKLNIIVDVMRSINEVENPESSLNMSIQAEVAKARLLESDWQRLQLLVE
ncbi:hypothetical protein C8J55DRAFT_493704 [Lentinula edodes]|uniref:Uncharacterized protein n=1 Tax=Lentinula lateritia TaxID=40482 RepID=A0A9W9DE35_9AGAR|nr:hypothetical protein C8J55DRAFT_493704 [Lentinula edodes]